MDSHQLHLVVAATPGLTKANSFPQAPFAICLTCLASSSSSSRSILYSEKLGLLLGRPSPLRGELKVFEEQGLAQLVVSEKLGLGFGPGRNPRPRPVDQPREGEAG